MAKNTDQDGLTPMDARFVEEYIVDLDGAASYRRAGGPSKNAAGAAWKLLQKPAVGAAIKTAVQERSTRTKVKSDDVLKELSRLGFANLRDYLVFTEDGRVTFDLANISREHAAAISEVTVEEFTDPKDPEKRTVKRTKFKLHDKRAALELIARHLDMFSFRRSPAEDTTTPEAKDLGALSDEQLDANIQQLYEEAGFRKTAARKGAPAAGRAVRGVRTN